MKSGQISGVGGTGLGCCCPLAPSSAEDHAWGVFLDPWAKSVVVSVRGTLSASDLATDLWCDEADLGGIFFDAFDEEEEEEEEEEDEKADPAGALQADPELKDQAAGRAGSGGAKQGGGGGGGSEAGGDAGSRGGDTQAAGEAAHAGALACARHVHGALAASRVLEALLDRGECPKVVAGQR